MVNRKHLICLDETCNNFLKEHTNKSEYVRETIKFFEANKNNSENTESTQPIIREIGNID